MGDKTLRELVYGKGARVDFVACVEDPHSNSYHAGQIALLRRQAGAWPPERCGDTW